MSGTINSVTSSVTNVTNQATTEASSASNTADEFEQIFMSLLLSNSSSDGLSSSGMGSDLMTPLMLILFEQLLANQVQQDSSSESTSQASSLNQVNTQSQVSSQSQADPADLAEPTGKPVDGVLTQGYHTGHYGLDLGVPIGTDVKTTMSGKVVYAGWNNEGYGNLVIVENGPYKTYYGHLSSVPVQVGQEVQAGSVIGISGSTGNSTGPHLHYEIRYNDQPIDPTQRTLNSPALWS